MGSAASHHSVCSHATEDGQESSSKSELSSDEEDAANENAMLTRVKPKLQVTARWHLMVKRGKNALQLKTPSPVLAKSSVHMKTPTHSLTLRRRSSPSGGSGGSPRRTVHPRNPLSHLRKSHPQMRHSVTRPGRRLSSWTHISMVGAVKRLLKASQAGPPKTP